MKQRIPSFMAWAGFLGALFISVHATQSSPLAKVIGLITQLQGQVVSEGAQFQSTFEKYSKWCERSSKEKQFEISDGKDEKEMLQAAIDKSKSDAAEAQARVEELSGGLATDGQDVKAITLIRVKEKNEFEAMDKELTATVTTISKARAVLKQQLDKAGLDSRSRSSFLQRPTKGLQLFAASVEALVSTAMGISAESRDRLTDLLQVQDAGTQSEGEAAEEGDEDSEAEADDAAQAPKAPVYQSKSGSILALLEKMEEEAETSQAMLRKKETKEKFNYEILKQRLEDRIKTMEKELEEQKKELASAKENGATAQGKLVQTVKGLAEDEKFLKKLQQGCMERASQFEMDTKMRNDELQALGAAKKTVQAIVFTQTKSLSPAPAEDADISAASFLQVGMDMSAEAYALRTAGSAVASRLKQLASDEHSVALAQLSSRVSATLKHLKGRGASADPFKKIKNLIQSMIAKLEKQQAGEAQQKKFCDAEMGQSKASKLDREGTIESLTTKIEEGVAAVAKLSQQKTMLLGEIKDIETSQGEMDAMRQEEHAAYKKVTKELQEGLGAVQTALKVLRDFYSQDDKSSAFIQDMSASMKSASLGSAQQVSTGGGGTAIIGLLEVCESDFSKGLAETEAEEETAATEYEKLTQENKKERAVKDKTVTNIASDVAGIEKRTSEFTGDRSETQQELSALLEYLEKLTKQCVAQPENFHDRVARRKREIDGLESALSMLEGQDGGQSEE